MNQSQRIKFFTDYDSNFQHVEDMCNEWLEENKIHVISIQYSDGHDQVLSVCIFYTVLQ